MIGRSLIVLAAALTLSGCKGVQSMFLIAGPEASRIIQLWWILFGLFVFVFVVTVGVLLAGALRRRPENEKPTSDKKIARHMAAGVALTVVILFGVIVVTFIHSGPIEPDPEAALTIDVVGKEWWWAVTYLNENGEALFETANEIHIPTNVPVRFRLRSDNVIHSFWVPSLAGKVDLIPGRINNLTLTADKSGVYRGQCAEFCGVQHTNMAFIVVAKSPEKFSSWRTAQQKPAVQPDSAWARQGREAFMNFRCAECHTIRGVSEVTRTGRDVGPDLTHLAVRETLASGTFPNNKGHLGGWLADPQGLKPGNFMPAVAMNSNDFRALLNYLQTLE